MGFSRYTAGWLSTRRTLYKGYSLVDVLQPCIAFNHVNTFKWYGERFMEDFR